MKIKTTRRICLTGTPFQNNLLEYYRMLSFIRPNILGDSEKKFQKDFIDPIQSGMASDTVDQQKVLADDVLTNFVNIVGPYIQRRDASLLLKDLPSLQQVCLHVPPTKIQRAFYGVFREHQEITNEKNFLKQYSSLRTIHNHPGTLLYRNESTGGSENNNQEELSTELQRLRGFKGDECIIEILSSNEEDDDSDEHYEPNVKWWTRAAKKIGAEKMKHIER